MTSDADPQRPAFPSPYLLLALTALFWAGNAVVARALHTQFPPVAMAFWRWSLALLLLLPFVLRAMHAQRELLRRYWGRLLLLGALGVSGFNTFLYSALQTTTATNGVLINSVTPLLILLMGRALFGVQITGRRLGGIALSLAGVAVIVSRGEAAVLSHLDFNHGDLLLLGSAFTWALYTVFLRWRPPGIGARAFLGATVMIGAALLFPLYLIEMARGGHATNWTLPVVCGLGYFAVFPSILAYLFWNRGVHQVGASRAGLFLYLIPIFGIALAVALLGEKLHWYHVAGAALIFTGIYVSSAAAGRGQGRA